MINNTAQLAAENLGHFKTSLFVLLKELQERLAGIKSIRQGSSVSTVAP